MAPRRLLPVLALLVVLLATAAPALAQTPTVPPNPGDFILGIVPGGAGPTGAMPACTPGLETLGALFMAGQTSVTAVCRDTSSSTQKPSVGTVSNPTLAGTTGDAGFASGTATMVCDTQQTTDMTLGITPPTSVMQRFSGTVFQACTFTLAFQDAAKSTLTGTVEVNGLLGEANAPVVDNVVTITIRAAVYVTAGTGAFSGSTGTGTFTQSQTINVDPNQAGGAPAVEQTAAVTAFCTANGISPCSAAAVGAFCQTRLADPVLGPQCAVIAPQAKRRGRVAPTARAASDAMKLTLTRKRAGTARILAPAPAAGKPKAAAPVKATTRVRVAATKGASCTVKASTGKTVGTGTATGRYGSIRIRPAAGAYRSATWIRATCTTKSGAKVLSNKVRISLR